MAHHTSSSAGTETRSGTRFRSLSRDGDGDRDRDGNCDRDGDLDRDLDRRSGGSGRRVLRPAASAALCLLALTGLSALTACDAGGAKATPGVASLPASPVSGASSSAGEPGASGASGGGKAPASPSASDAGTAQPQERLDDTPEERQALIHAWDQCLVDHGARWTTTQAGVAGRGKQVAEPIPAPAHAACENKLPQEPPELNPSLNPHYRDDTLAEVACLRHHGVMVHLVADTSVDPHGLSWTFDSSTTKVPANESELEDQCQLAAFGGGKGK
jgi:hypothetical protein